MARLTTKQWQQVGKQYRAGQVSVLQIAKQFGVSNTAIDNHAKKAGWTRDLTRKTQHAVEAGAISAAVGESAADMTSEQIVEEFALIGVQVITQHRRDIHALRMRRETLMRRYDVLTRPDERGKERINDLDTVALAAQILDSIARMDHRIVVMERIAFNLNVDDDNEPRTIRVIGGLPEPGGMQIEHQPTGPKTTDVEM